MINASKIPNSGGKFTPPPALDPGSYPARLVQVIGLGLQKRDPYKGEEKAPQYELHLTYELDGEFMEDEDGNPDEEKPRWISETIPLYSLEVDRAKSTKRYTALDPKLQFGGDWSKLIETPCNIVLVQKASKKDASVIYNNVSDVSAMRPKEALRAAPLVNEPKIFDPEEPDMDVFNALPKWLQEKIKGNLDYEGSVLEKLVSSGGETEKKGTKSGGKKKVDTPDVDEEDDDEEPW